MQKSKIILLFVIGLVIGIVAIPVASALLSGGSQLVAAPRANATELGEDERRGTPVQVARVQMGPVETVVTYSGSVKPAAEVDVIPKASGRIEKVEVQLGDHVDKGDVLAVIESDTLKAQLEQAQAALKVAEIKIEQMREGGRPEQIAAAQAAVEAAQAKLDRVKAPLNENEQAMAKAAEVQARAALQAAQAAYDQIAWYDAKGMMPQSVALQQATAAYEAARAKYEEAMAGAKPEDIRAAQAMVDQAKAQLELAKNPYRESDLALAAAQYLQAKAAVDLMEIQVKETVVRAPISGVVSKLPVSVGSMAAPTAALATIVSDDVEVVIRVEESRIGEVAKGQPSKISVAAYPGQTFAGRVSLIAPTANAADRTFEVRIKPDEVKHPLRGGMFAEVNLVMEQYANALMVPKTAVNTENGQSYVFVVVGDRVEKRAVATGLTQKDMVQIRSGVALGEQVVVSGLSTLQPGDVVQVVNG